MSRKLIAKIHILKKQLGLDDETYRTLLKNETGKDSAAKCSPKQLHKAINAMQGNTNNQNIYNNNAKSPRYKACYAKWQKLHELGVVKNNSSKALNSFIARIIPAFEYHNFNFDMLDNNEANKAVDTLQAYINRIEKE